jgi:hypothetical protein
VAVEGTGPRGRMPYSTEMRILSLAAKWGCNVLFCMPTGTKLSYWWMNWCGAPSMSTPASVTDSCQAPVSQIEFEV